MTYKNCIKGLLLFLGTLLILSLLNTILYHYDIINSNMIKILEITTLILSTIISGFYIGIKSKNKGYINGLTLGGIITVILIILKIIINKKITLISILIYLILLLLTISSSILGINKKK